MKGGHSFRFRRMKDPRIKRRIYGTLIFISLLCVFVWLYVPFHVNHTPPPEEVPIVEVTEKTTYGHDVLELLTDHPNSDGPVAFADNADNIGHVAVGDEPVDYENLVQKLFDELGYHNTDSEDWGVVAHGEVSYPDDENIPEEAVSDYKEATEEDVNHHLMFFPGKNEIGQQEYQHTTVAYDIYDNALLDVNR